MNADVPAPPSEESAPPKPSPLGIVRRAPAATVIIIVNLVVFLLADRPFGSTSHPATLIRYGAVWRELVWQGQYWRLATSMFLHIGWIHLLWNGYYGFRISAQVERVIGSWRFLVLYLVSGVAGSAASVIGHDAVSAGASGALFGLIGWQIMAARARLGSFRAMWEDPGTRRDLTWIGGWFVVGAFAGFDNFAHGGGLAFGLAFSWALLGPAPARRGRFFLAFGAAAALVLLALRPLPVLHAKDLALRKAYRSQDNPATVLALTEPLLGSDKRFAAETLRGQALLTLGRYQEAIDAAEDVIAHEPNNAVPYVTRGGARLMLGDRAAAEADFARGIALDSTSWSRDVVEAYRRARSP